MDLIPSEVSDVKQKKIIYMLKKHRCVCQATLTFRFLPIKYKRSRRTLIMFVFALSLLVWTHLTLVIPGKYYSFFSFLPLLLLQIYIANMLLLFLFRITWHSIHLHHDGDSHNTLDHRLYFLYWSQL